MNNFILNNISVAGFWAMIKEHLISIRLPGMDKNIHFTIAFNENSPEINLHVTKNPNNITEKLSIEILRIPKQDLNDLAPYIAHSFFYSMFRPVRFRNRRRKSRNFFHDYLFYDLEGQKIKNDELVASHVASKFKNISTLKSGRLKIKGDIEKYISSLVSDELFIDKINDNLKPLPRIFKNPRGAGFIISKDTEGVLIRINNQWFKLNDNWNPYDWLQKFMPPKLVDHIKFKILVAYARIKGKKSFVEPNNSNSIFLKIMRDES